MKFWELVKQAQMEITEDKKKEAIALLKERLAEVERAEKTDTYLRGQFEKLLQSDI